MAEVLVNIDVEDLERAVAFYRDAFELTVGRRFGRSASSCAADRPRSICWSSLRAARRTPPRSNGTTTGGTGHP
jgi:hypothetical protein